MESYIDSGRLRQSVFALLKWKSIQASKNLQIDKQKLEEREGDEESEENYDFLYLVLTLKNVPAKSLQSIPHKIPLPHSLHPFPNICLIIADGPKKSTGKLTVDAVQKKIKSEDIPISKVIKLAKLRSCYNDYDSRQKFCDSYDVFLADEKINGLLPSILGKLFYKKKIPIPVSLKARINSSLSWKEEVQNACSSELLSFGSGTCHSVRVGKRGIMEGAQIIENVKAAIDGIINIVPKKWKGVAAIHLKFSDSLAMPIYQSRNASGLISDEDKMMHKDLEVSVNGGKVKGK